MKFNSATDGYITGVRFYKSEALTGTHTGHVWSAAGSMLAAAIFTNELDSGWQQVMFDTPVPVTAGTSYIVSYYSSSGQYSATNPCQVYLYQKYLMQED